MVPALDDLNVKIISPTSFQTSLPSTKKSENIHILGYMLRWSLKADMAVIAGSTGVIPIDGKQFKVDGLEYGNMFILTKVNACMLLLIW